MSSARPRAKRRLHPIERADLALADAAAVDGRTAAAHRIATIAGLGDQPPLRLLCALTMAAGVVRGDPKLVRTGLRMLAAHSVATAAKSIIKHRVDRTRPADAMKNGRYRMDKGTNDQKRLTSMPSGHSAGLAAVASAAAREYPGAAPAFVAAAGSIIAAQLPAKTHFLSDLVAGTAIGIAAEAGVSALMTAAAGRD